MKIKRKLSNSRPVQDQAPELVLATTEGTIKVTWPICERLSVDHGERLVIEQDDEGIFYLRKGEGEGDGNILSTT